MIKKMDNDLMTFCISAFLTYFRDRRSHTILRDCKVAQKAGRRHNPLVGPICETDYHKITLRSRRKRQLPSTISTEQGPISE